MRVVVAVLVSWIVLSIALPLLAIFVASRRSRNAVPPAPVVELVPDAVEVPTPRTITIKEGAGRSSHRHRLHGEGSSLYGEAERLARIAKEARS